MNNFFQNRIHLTLKTKATVVRQPVLQVTKSVCVFMMVQARLLLQKMLVPAFLVLYTRRCQYSCISVTVVYKYHFASSSQLTSHYARVHFKSNRKKNCQSSQSRMASLQLWEMSGRIALSCLTTDPPNIAPICVYTCICQVVPYAFGESRKAYTVYCNFH